MRTPLLAAALLAVAAAPAFAGGALEELAQGAGAAAPKRPAAPPFATCVATMEGGIQMTLGLYRDKATQTVGNPRTGESVPFFPLKAELLAEDEKRTRVRLFVVDTEDKVFAEFDVPKAPESKVSIYARNMGDRLWGEFTCRR